MDSRNTEETIFILDLPTDYISKEELIKVIKNFIELKKTFNEANSFGIVLLQSDYNPVFVYDQTDIELLTNVIDVKYDLRPRDQSYIENGLFEVLSYIFGKSRQVKKVYRVMVISDTPTQRSDEYYQAIYDLIIKSKRFSTFIDIIRVGENDDYDDDIKLKAITSETHGGTFYCNLNQFNDVFCSLVKSKQDFNVIRPEEAQILNQDKKFYERLAVDLISLNPEDEEMCDICQFELCPLCGAYSDEIHKCYNCGGRFHSCCIARYSITNNIGFKHIFRCPKCQNLLKLDEEFVDLIFEEEFEGLEPIPETSLDTIPETVLEAIPELVLETADEYEENDIITEVEPVQEVPQEEIVEDIVDEQLSEEIEEPILTIEDLDEQIRIADDMIETISSVEEFKEETEKSEEISTETKEYSEKVQPTKIISIPQKPKIEELDIKKSIEEIKYNLEEIPSPPPIQRKVKIGGYFGHEVEIRTGKKAKKRPVKILEPQFEEKTKSITKLKPPPRKRAKMKFCKICGASVLNIIVCPNCGAQID